MRGSLEMKRILGLGLSALILSDVYAKTYIHNLEEIITVKIEGGKMKQELKKGSVVQLSPEHPKLPGVLIVVTEPKEWGCQGYIVSPYDTGESLVKYKGRAFTRAKFEDFEYVGELVWMEAQDEVD